MIRLARAMRVKRKKIQKGLLTLTLLLRVTINCLSLAFHSSMRSGGKEACLRKENVLVGKKEKAHKIRRKQSVECMNSLAMI